MKLVGYTAFFGACCLAGAMGGLGMSVLLSRRRR